ncbi:hypothetical protein [Persicitalea sp.]|uniref:hypothetical protein n=1 Tax=Persicitalea sp. TaxID=3100273 RepID=UPI0035932E66
MNDADFYNKFYLGLAIAGAVVVIAATLLILIWVAARRILKLAHVALGIVVNIKQNTLSIWELQHTNHKALGILEEAEGIETKAGAVAHALHETETTV